MNLVSCVKDAPLKERRGKKAGEARVLQEDTLKAGRYGRALSEFIRHADTPVTIGIQGGWGSGKTSLFSIIQADLEEKRPDRPLCVTVNAWEHSLFQNSQGKSMVVLSILTSIIDAIQREVEGDEELEKADKAFIKDQLAPMIKKSFNLLGRCLPSIVGAAIGAATGATVSASAPKSPDGAEEAVPRLAEQIRSLRQNLADLVSHIKRNGKPAKTVIFIDDLDRVQPAGAVEILDVIKNVFDVENCVFVLAIDYEVVVKGLESKFGARTEKNEREFRQYFDKIIQVPFSMPIGSYSREMRGLLSSAFQSLEKYQCYRVEDKALDRLAYIAKLATGGNPRSIKRILNTLSLLQYIPDPFEESLTLEQKLLYLQVRFVIIALHLNYPEISRHLMANSKFTDWSLPKLNAQWDLDLEKHRKDLEALAQAPELQAYFDEDWEKVIYCLCANSDWLKRKAWNVSRLMNMLRSTLNSLGGEEAAEELEAAPLTDAAMEALSYILDTIAVVSIESGPDAAKEKFKYDAVSRSLKALHQALAAGGLKKVVAPPTGREHAEEDEIDETRRVYKINGAKSGAPLIRIEYARDDGSAELSLRFCGDAGHRDESQIKAEILKARASAPEYADFSYAISGKAGGGALNLLYEWDLEDGALENTEELSRRICECYKNSQEMLK